MLPQHCISVNVSSHVPPTLERMFTRTVLSRVATFLASALLCASTALAQSDRATVSGTVVDPSDAAVPGATVTITSVATSVASSTVTNREGAYLVVDLLPGEYRVSAEVDGFTRAERTLRLEIGMRARIDIQLAVSGVAETATVTAAAPVVNTQNAVLGQVVHQNEIAKLPLAIRNWDDLLALVPGVQGDRYTEESGSTSAGRTGGVSIHGNRSLQNNFLLDGVDNNSISENVQELSTQVSRPSIDAITEFKVNTTPYAAEFGRAPGGAISVSTKSGTNQFRGTAYDYVRDDRFDSKTFFARRANQAKAANNQNQFGANLGGPLLMNRAFFFGDYEGTRITKGVVRASRVATPAERAGVFASAIRDPLTGLPFANNTIPSDRIDPVAAKILALLPQPNTSGTNNYFVQPNVEDNGNRGLVRADLRIGKGDNMFVRYINTKRTREVPGFIGGVLDGTSTSAWGRNFLNSQSLVGGWTKVLSGTMINELRVSWARGRSDGQQIPFGTNGLDQIGFKGVPQDPAVLGGIVGMDISGHVRLGSPNFMPKYQHTDQVQYVNTLSWLRGRHQWKFGADIMAPMNNTYMDIPSTRGNLQFSGQYTGNALADFILGYARTAELSNVFIVNQRHWSTGFFAQDDWRVSDRLTLNIGLRYDFMTPAFEANNQMANFDPATGTLVYAKAGSLADRALVNPDTNNVAPRLGLVYRLSDTSVLRGGYGVFYNLFDRMGSEDQIALNPPGLRNINIQTGSTTTPVLFLKDGFPSTFLDPSNINLKNLLIRAADSKAPDALFQQFSGGIEHQLGAMHSLSVDLVGNLGRNIAILRNINQPLAGTLDANGALPYPNFTNVQWREMKGTSRYYGVDTSFQRRFSDGYSYRVSYTYGNSIDQAPEHLAAGSGRPQNGRDLAAWEGPSDFDIRHRFTTDFVIETPFGPGKPFLTDGVAGAILGHWTVSGILTARTGRPFTVTQGTNNVGPGATGVPNLIGNPEGNRTVDSWFNVAAFQAVTSGTFGNAGRNILRGPGFATVDLSVQRRLPIASRAGLTLRWDVFNVLNRANFGQPDSNINSATVSTITSLAGDPRAMQFALRLDF